MSEKDETKKVVIDSIFVSGMAIELADLLENDELFGAEDLLDEMAEYISKLQKYVAKRLASQ